MALLPSALGPFVLHHMSFGSDSPRVRQFILNFSLFLHLRYETWSSTALSGTATFMLNALNSLVVPFLSHFRIILSLPTILNNNYNECIFSQTSSEEASNNEIIQI